MYRISFKPSFLRQIKHLDEKVLSGVLRKIELLKEKDNHQYLKVHKLHGILSNCYSFSINYSIRVIFRFEFKKEIVLLYIGNHDIYK